MGAMTGADEPYSFALDIEIIARPSGIVDCGPADSLLLLCDVDRRLLGVFVTPPKPRRRPDPWIREELGPAPLATFLASGAAWIALAGVMKAWINRRTGRKVVLYGPGGKKRVEITGDMSAAEIEALLRATAGTPELDAPPTGDDES